MSAVDQVLGRLEGVKKAGHGWTARCPAHEDHTPSLSIDLGDGGRVLIKCQAGCNTADVLGALELTLHDLFEPDTRAQVNAPRTIEATYDYFDERGELLFQAVRYVPKDFRQRRPDGRGGWIYSLRGVRRVLFQLPLVLSAVKQGHTVYIVEGERDVLELEAAGVVATCNPMGAGKWCDEYAESLRGASVVVVADNDEPGIAHARAVAASLARVGVVAQLVRAREGKDATDHLAAGHGPEDFEPLPADATEATAVEPFRGHSHDDVLRLEFEAPRYLIEDLIPAGAVGTIAGVPETHKSWVAHAIAVRVALGEGEVLGCSVAEQANVGYFWQDDSTREEAERVKLFERVHASRTGLPLRWFLNDGLALPRDLERLRRTIEEFELGLAVLDSFYNFLPEINLKDEGAELVVSALKRKIADATGCTVLLVDHMPWATDTNRARLRAYGGVFKNAATRFGIYIDAQGKKLYAEARGNNTRGFRKTPAYWDDEALELRLVDAGEQSHDERLEERAEQALAWLQEHPRKHATSAVRKAVGGRASVTDQALELLKSRDDVQDFGRDGGTWSGRRGDPRYWIARSHAGLNPDEGSSQLFGTTSDDVGPGSHDEHPRPVPYKGTRGDRDDVSSGEPAEAEAVSS
ncbi:MAG: AAA family ATPase [Gaiellaceae bacterium]